MRLLPIVRILLAVLLILPASAEAARNSDQELRECQQRAMQSRDERTIDITREYQRQSLSLMEEQRDRSFDHWGIENDRDRYDRQRDMEKDIRNRQKDLDYYFRQEQKNIANDFRIEDRACRDQFEFRLKQVPVGQICRFSDECRPPLGYCTTETGDCRLNCRFDSDSCPRECTGKCRLR